MRVLVTRPRDEAEETAALLVARGHEAIIAPLLEIRFRAGKEIALGDVQAILATSANGIRALARRTRRRDVKVFAVGAQSAQVARAAGFGAVEHAAGDAAALASLVAARLEPEDGMLFHAAGAETRGALAQTLSQKGYIVRSEVLYDAVAANALPNAAIEALSDRRLDAALFFSPRSAGIFGDLARGAGLEGACRGLFGLCISQATADALAPLAFRDVKVAPHPDQESVLALLD